jgi:hypothetical protein
VRGPKDESLLATLTPKVQAVNECNELADEDYCALGAVAERLRLGTEASQTRARGRRAVAMILSKLHSQLRCRVSYTTHGDKDEGAGQDLVLSISEASSLRRRLVTVQVCVA